MKYQELEIEIVELFMDKTNPRHPPLEGQIEIIRWMTDGNARTGEKLFALAKDIVSYGINPAELAMVTKSNTGDGYIVLEGNRRITSIKLLNNPKSAPTEHWQKKLEN